MAEFCEACAAELGHPYGDFRDMVEEGKALLVLCEGCGPTYVDHNGNCVASDCYKKDQPGHGIKPDPMDYLKKALKWWEDDEPEWIIKARKLFPQQPVDGPEYEDGPWAEGWEDRNKGGG